MTAGAPVTLADINADNSGLTDTRAFLALAESMGSLVEIPPGTYLVTANLSMTKVLRFAPGAVLKPAAGVNLALFGEIIAGFWQIFDTSLGGTITGAVRNQHIYPDWWGAVPNVASNQQVKIQEAINFAQANCRTVYLRNGDWRCDATLFITHSCSLVGDPGVPGLSVAGGNTSALNFSNAPASSDGVYVETPGTFIDGVLIENIAIYKNTPTAGSFASGLKVVAASHSQFRQVTVWNYDFNFSVGGSSLVLPCLGCIFYNCRSRFATRWHWNIYSAIDTLFQSCRCELGSATIGMHILEVLPAAGPNGNFYKDCLFIMSDATDGMRISYGFWHVIDSCVFEGNNSSGITVNIGASDLSLLTCSVTDCWFNDSGNGFVSEGLGGNFRITNNRFDISDATKVGGIVIGAPSGGATERDIHISGNVIKHNCTNGQGISLDRVAGAFVHHNRIWGYAGAAGNPGIRLYANTAQCIIDHNRTTTTFGTADGIINLGSGNVLDNNFKV